MTNRQLLGRVLLGATALAAASIATPASAQRVDQIIAFGDSYADDGNAIAMLLASPFVPAARSCSSSSSILQAVFPAAPITSILCPSC